MGVIQDFIKFRSSQRQTETQTIDTSKKAADLTTASNAFFSTVGGGFNQNFSSFNNQKQQLNAYVDWVYSAVRTIAQQAATIDIRLFVNRTKSNNITLAHKMFYSPDQIKIYRKQTVPDIFFKDGRVQYKAQAPAIEEIETHPLLDLLNAPNPYMTRNEFFELAFTHLELTGDCFWAINRTGKNNKGQPQELWPLMPNMMQVVPDAQKFIIGYIYTVNGVQIPFAPEDIIHIKYANPTDFRRGMSAVMAGARAIDTDAHAADYNRKFFYNSAQPDAVLQTDNILDDEVYKRLTTEWSDKYGGTYNAHRTAILEDGLKYTPMALTQKDMDFLNSRNFNRDQILAMFGVPKSLIGLNEDVNRAAAETAEYVFSKGRIRPKMMLLANRLTQDLAPQFDERLIVSFTDPVPEDKEFLLKEKAELVDILKTKNEIRADNGDDTVKGGDELYVPSTFIPVGQDMTTPLRENKPAVIEEDDRKPDEDNSNQGSEDEEEGPSSGSGGNQAPSVSDSGSSSSDTTNSPKSADSKKKDSNQFSLVNTEPASGTGTIGEVTTIDASIEDIKAAIDNNLVSDGKPEDTMSHARQRANDFVKQRNRVTAAFQIRFMRESKDRFLQQKSEVMSRVNTRFGNKTVAGMNIKMAKKELAGLFDDGASLAAWIKAFTPIYYQAAEDIGDVAFEMVKPVQKSLKGVKTKVAASDFTTATEAIKRYFAERAGTVSRGIDEETDKQLRASLTEGINDGENLYQLMNRIEDIYSAAAGYRAERIARTESATSASFASQQAWLQSGVVDENEWMVDGNPCPICESNDGMVAVIGEAFLSGDDGPPAHPNCECALLPVVSGISYTDTSSDNNVDGED